MSADPYKYFRVEAKELLEQLGQGALEIARSGSPAAGIAALLRYAHTLKGAARVVKQGGMANGAHAIEDALLPYRAAGSGIPKEVADALFAQLDAMAAALAELGGHAEPTHEAAAAEPAAATLRAELGDVDEVIEGLGQSLVQLQALSNTMGAIERGRRLCQLLGRQLGAPRRADPAQLALALERAQRVTEALASGLGHFEQNLRQGLDRLRSELGETHGNAERLRLIPVQTIFGRLERAANDAAEELSKRVSFAGSGGEVRVDGHVLGTAEQALLHVVRNAVAHGLEREGDRLALGKTSAGRIELAVRRAGGELIFRCSDDGAGLDVDAVQRQLRNSGSGGGSAGHLSESELVQRLLAGGVSTAAQLSGVSGRGVGLDVVRAAAEKLGGSVEIETRRGKGFVVTLRVPVSVTAFSALGVECGGRAISVPLSSVVKSVRVTRSEIAAMPGGEGIWHENGLIPFAPLGQVLGGAPDGERAAWSCLIVNGAAGRVALGVDRLLGARVVVQRPLPKGARISEVVAGANLDALGNPELVLEPEALVNALQTGVRAAPKVDSVRAPILIVDDSLTTRMLEQSILESAGYHVELATSGEEGLAKARDQKYALFLVDVEMPGIDGFTFVDQARRDPGLMDIPAVLVSSRSAPEDFARGKAVGARGYIVKDRFDQRELLGLIRELTGS